MREARVEFRHGRGCDLGMPYGGCSENCQWHVVEFVTDRPGYFPSYKTLREALERTAPGWSLQCNLCGEYGAKWHRNQRPGWGDLALCPRHSWELEQETRRHDKVMAALRTINFEQDRSAVDREYKEWTKERRAAQRAEEAHAKELRRQAREQRKRANESKQEAKPIPWEASTRRSS